MGKKVKTGKSRKDKFYQLAKESGFRARSAFKLLQLNRKYEFLQKARVCIDLCAAPGGWLQVASQQMPVSSIIIGVDLVPIRPIPRCTTFQEDITTAKCRQTLRKELQTWEADVFLNDGAPNVGKSWIHDAFMQAELTLAALKLATEFLRKGGWFVTKVFRSKDYHALMWVFNQLFKKVFATKPQASRNESAEIFVVCQYYVKPDKLDPKFLDPKYVFKDVQEEGKKSLNVLYPTKVKKKAEGYADGDMTLHHKLSASEFISADNFLDLLGDANEVVLDDPVVAKHELTTKEIKSCCADIKVLGKKEIRLLVAWRKKMRAHLAELRKAEEEENKEEKSQGDVEEIDSEGDDEETQVDKQIADLKESEVKEEKKKRKKVMKEKRKLRDKMNLKMVIKGDHMDLGEDMELFNLKKIKNKEQLAEVGKEEMLDESEESDSDDDLPRKNMVSYDRHANEFDADSSDSGDSDDEDGGLSEDEEEEDLEMEEMDKDESNNPLVVELESSKAKANQKMANWFSKDVFSGLEGDDDEDIEIEKMSEAYRKKGGVILGSNKDDKSKKKKKKHKGDEDDVDSGNVTESDDQDEESSEDSDDSDSDSSDYDIHESLKTSGQKKEKEKNNNKASKDGFEIVPQGHQPAKKIRKLDAEGLALGEELIKSSKRRREIIEMSFNRHTFNDVGLPDWFVKDESRHNRVQLPVTKDQVEAYKERLKAINAQPIKKIAEAKARKKRKFARKLEKARKKAEVVSDTVDVSDKEKMQQIKQIYKRAGLLKAKKEDVTYVVAKRGVGRRVSRPAGVKGRFKVVDGRMKKDLRSQKIADKKAKGKKGKGKGRGKK